MSNAYWPRVNVVDYFAAKHNVRCNPKLPCIVAGSASKPIHFPMEVCDVPEQRQRLLADAKATADMIRFTATPPVERRTAIERTVRDHVSNQSALHRTAFNVEVSAEMTSVNGRVLKPPAVVYKNGKLATPSRGAWNLVDHVLLNPPPAPLTRWALVSLDITVTELALRHLGERFRRGMQKFGGFVVPGDAALVSLFLFPY